MTTEFYQSNIAILKERCPELAEAIEQQNIDHLNFEVIERKFATLSVNGVQLSSAYDPVEEALAYRSTTSGNTYHIWGFGIGSVPEIFLTDKNLQKIHLYIYNLDVIKLVLTLVAKPWLADKRIELCYVHKDMPNLGNALSKLFVADSFVINADLSLAKRPGTGLDWLTHRIENRLVATTVNQSHSSDKNKAKLKEIDKENYSLLKKLPVLDHLVENNKFEHVLCIGSGPSLDRHIEQVKELLNSPNRPLIIAPSTALKALVKYDVQPDIVTIADINVNPLYIPYEKLNNTILVGNSRIKKEIFERWEGKQYYMHMIDDTFDDINQKLPSKYRLNTMGSVIHPIMHMAVLFGAKTIRLVGCDCGFPDEIQHASSNDNYQIDMDVYIENGHGQLIKSSPIYRMFCSGIENIISQCKHIDFINMSRIGAKIIGARYEDEGK